MNNRDLLLDLKHLAEQCVIAHPADRMLTFNASFQKLNTLLTSHLENLYACFSTDGILAEGLSFSVMTDALSAMTDAIAGEDYIRLTDVMEQALIPLLEAGLRVENSKKHPEEWDDLDVNLSALSKTEAGSSLAEQIRGAQDSDNAVSVFYAESGEPSYSLSVRNESFFLCGTTHPYRDALIRASHWREEDFSRFVLLGIGMVYEADALLHATAGVPVVLLEEDPVLLKTVLRTQNLTSLLANPRFRIVLKPLQEVLTGYLDADTRLLYTLASIRAVKNDYLRERIARFRINTVTETNQPMRYDFKKNTATVSENAAELLSAIENKPVFLVARGPSLDPMLPLLQKRSSDSVILCVESASGKLIKYGIHPDYIVLTESNPAIIRHMDAAYDYGKTALIFLATAAENAVSSFRGRKYIVYQKDFTLSEEAAAREGQMLFSTGGSVATLCLDIAIRLKAKSVICLGLDFAYTGNRTHAAETRDSLELQTVSSAGIHVKGVSGDTLETTRNLDMYRKWVEKRLQESAHPLCYNLSDGAYIEGMKNIPTAEALSMDF